MNVLREKYGLLLADAGFQNLRAVCPIYATWDDHDYGVNDGGADYPRKVESQKIMLETFREPPASDRWKRPGVYGSRVYGPPRRRVQIIMLDTRYFRSPLKALPPEQRVKGQGYYLPDSDPSKTMLGEEQWAWLEKELRKPAELRIICSSIQVLSDQHAWERWGQFPHERQRLLKLIRDTKANGVVFLSGDRHHAEISRDDASSRYPLYDITSSALNQTGFGNEKEPNRFRRGTVYPQSNFGTIQIDWTTTDTKLTFSIHDLDGRAVRQDSIALSQLFKE
jgi:alkaline phosphatase D